MGATKTVHPPAGATALLAATSPDITQLGWFLLPLVLLGSALMLASACIINNMHRQFPVYWWTPVDLGPKRPYKRRESCIERLSEAEEEEARTDAGSCRLSRVKTKEEMHFDREHEIKITSNKIIIPNWLQVNDWERSVLEIIRERLKEGVNQGIDWDGPTDRESDSSGDEEKGKPQP
jgi:HPP family